VNRRLWLGLLVVTLLLAVVVSGFASSSPDGLERAAEDHGFATTQEPEQTSVFVGYDSPGARVMGVMVVVLVAGGLTMFLRRRRED